MLTVTDPATGEKLSIKELAERHSVPYHRIYQRLQVGIDGWELVEPPRKIDPREAMRLKVIAAEHTNRIALARYLKSPRGRLATRLFKDYRRDV